MWVSALGAMTYVALRDGAPAGSSGTTIAIVMGALWIFAIGLVAYMSTQSCLHVAVHEGRVTATWRYPHKVLRKELPVASVRLAEVVRSRDGEGDPYFHARITSGDGKPIDILEGHDRAACEQACHRFNRALHEPGSTNRL